MKMTLDQLVEFFINKGFEITKNDVLKQLEKNNKGAYVLLNKDVEKWQVFEFEKVDKNTFYLKVI